MTQFESWETVLGIFVCLNIIQFVVGSYVLAARVRKRAVHFSIRRAVRDFPLDLHLGSIGHVHWCATRPRHSGLNQATPIQPMASRSARWTGTTRVEEIAPTLPVERFQSSKS